MTSIYKRQTLIRTICFMSFFVAINVICSFLTTLFPLVSVILIIFLPLTSALVEVMCKDRWFPIYAFATIGLSIVVSLSSIDFTLFYIVPSIVSGYIFGLFAKHRLPSMYAIFFASLAQTLLSFLFIPILKLITGINIIDFFAKILRISDIFWFNTLVLLIFFIVSLIQTILSYIVVNNELVKFTRENPWKLSKDNVASVSCLISIVFMVAFSFFYLPASYFLLGIAFYFGVFVAIEQAQLKQKVSLIIDAAVIFVVIVLYAILNKYIKDGYDLLLFGAVPTLISIVSIFHYFLKKSEQ